MISRRAFIGSVAGGLVAVPLAAAAQPKVSRVGYLSSLSRSDPTYATLRDALLQGLREHGYVEGRTITIEWRFAEGSQSRLPNLAAELVHLRVDLLFAEATPSALAAKQATITIPIVFSPIADPIGSGLVATLARPGGNITGLTFVAPELVGKRLELLKETVPGMKRVGGSLTSRQPERSDAQKHVGGNGSCGSGLGSAASTPTSPRSQ